MYMWYNQVKLVWSHRNKNVSFLYDCIRYFNAIVKNSMKIGWLVPWDMSSWRFCKTLITCVIARSNPRRLLPIWREKLRCHYHGTMTSDNDFCMWRWHYRERHSRVSVNEQIIARNAPRIRALITSRNDRHFWTDRNSFTGMCSEMIKNAVFFVFLSKKNTHKTHEMSK